MKQLPQNMIMESLKNCIESNIDLATFAEEYCFHYLYLDEGPFKSECMQLFEAATDFLIFDSTAITPETILYASDFFDKIKSTHHRLQNLN